MIVNDRNGANHTVNLRAATSNQSFEVTCLLQIILVSIYSGGNRRNANAFVDSASTVSFIDQNVQEMLQAQR